MYEWGTFSRFLEYTQVLNCVLAGGNDPAARSHRHWRRNSLRTSSPGTVGTYVSLALLSGLLLLTFAAAMTLALGVKAPLNYAVFTGVGGALVSRQLRKIPIQRRIELL